MDELSNVKLKILNLKNEISKHDKLYYIKSKPIICDKEYDDLRAELNHLESLYPNLQDEDSVTKTVGVQTDHRFKKIPHLYPMLSLRNAFNKNEVQNFLEKLNKTLETKSKDKIEILCEPKIDGVSFSACYKRGKFLYATTRGDGKIGEDITHNFKVVKNFPIEVKCDIDFEIRGEVYMKKSDFLDLNKNLEQKNTQTFANPRNASSGSLRQLNYKVTSERKLSYFVWGGNFPDTETQYVMMKTFKNLGFAVNSNMHILTDIEEIYDFYTKMCEKRAELDYDIDGLVYKVNKLSLQRKMGNTAIAPRWAIAHKFPADQAETKIEDILIQIGRTGIATPVAKLKPVNIGGVLVTKASLHNKEEIIKKDIRIGDFVIVKRAGDVIPQIVEVKLEKRDNNLVKSFQFPIKCHICNGVIINRRCTNGLKCEAQLIESLCHLISKSGFNIEGLSKKSITLFYKKGLIKAPVDIFKLRENNFKLEMPIQNWQGWGAQSAYNLFNSIDKSRNILLSNFIYAMGMRHVGKTNAEQIAKHFVSLNNLLKFIENVRENIKDIEQVNGIGRITAFSIYDYFSNECNLNMIRELLPYITVQENITSTDLKKERHLMLDKKIIFTGTFEKYSRQELSIICKQKGMIVVPSWRKDIDYLVYGQRPGSKLKKATSLNIKVLSEALFLNIIQSL